MVNITSFSEKNAGQRDKMEDYTFNGVIETEGGLNLHILLVADGAGGADAGEQAAREAMRTVTDYITSSHETLIPKLLIQAIEKANETVYDLLQGEGTSTLGMIAIDLEDESKYGRAYIAHVGDTYIGLMRERQLVRLNINHTTANEYLYAGQITEDEAARLANGSYATRIVGMNPGTDIAVDIGFYSEGGQHVMNAMRAFNIGRLGMKLEEGDTLFVASDGLFEINPEDNEPYLRDEELLLHAMDNHAENAARNLVRYATNRRVNDNVALVLGFVPSPRRKAVSVNRLTRNQQFMLSGLVATLVVVILFAIIQWNVSRSEIIGIQGTATHIAQAIFALTPPTPTQSFTATPVPTDTVPNQIGLQYFGVFSPRTPVPVVRSEESSDPEQSFIIIDSEGVNPEQALTPPERGAAIFLLPEAIVNISRVSVEERNEQYDMMLFPDEDVEEEDRGGEFFANNHEFYERAGDRDAMTLFIPQRDDMIFIADAECVAARHIRVENANGQSSNEDESNRPGEELLAFTCFNGDCRAQLPDGQPDLDINAGSRYLFDVNLGVLLSIGPVQYEEVTRYYDMVVELTGNDTEISCVDEQFLDIDGDGVPYPADECELERGSISANGCLDDDGDGIPNERDQCPNVIGDDPVNPGCPTNPELIEDVDGDGLAFAADNCPYQAGPESNDGCPGTATVTPTATTTPTATNTPTATRTPTISGTLLVTLTVTETPSNTPTATITPTATNTPTTTITPTETDVATVTASATIEETPTVTQTPTETVEPTEENIAPTASFTINPNPPGLTDGADTVEFTLDGSSSSDSDGSIIRYSWSINESVGGQQVFVDSFITTNPTTNYTLGEGTYTIQLVVTDNGNATSTTNQTITIAASNLNADASATDNNISDNEDDGETVTLDASNSSTDPGVAIVSYEWSYNDENGDPQTETGETANVNLPIGEYDFLLTIIDENGNQSVDVVTVNINAQGIPFADASNTQQNWVDNNNDGFVTISLDGSASFDPNPGNIVSWEWEVVGGGPVIDEGETSSVTLPIGISEIQLTVTDDDGNQDTTTFLVNIEGGVLQADASATYAGGPWTDDGDGSTTVTMDGSNSSTSPGVNIVNYAWLDANGNLLSTGSDPQQDVDLGNGWNRITLVVTDEDGENDTQSFWIRVDGTIDADAYATTFNWYDPEGDGENVTLDGSNSNPQASITSYTWSDENGVISTGPDVQQIVNLAPGVHTLTLTASDGTNSSIDTIVVRVYNQLLADASNTISYWYDEGGDGTTVTLNGSASDLYSSTNITNYAWSWVDENGIPGLGSLLNADPTANVYLLPGTYTVTLTVTDENGDTATDTTTVTVEAGPSAMAGGTPTVASGAPVILNGSNSSDVDGTIVNWEWDVVGSGYAIPDGATSGIVLPDGTYEIELTVTDNDGYTDTDRVIITVGDPLPMAGELAGTAAAGAEQLDPPPLATATRVPVTPVVRPVTTQDEVKEE